MYELRGIITRLGAVGLALWVWGCAGAPGDSATRGEQLRRAGAESRRAATERAAPEVVGDPKGGGNGSGEGEPGTPQGSNTNWRPGESGPGRDPLPWPLNPDDPEPALDPEEPDDTRDEVEDYTYDETGPEREVTTPSSAPTSASGAPAGTSSSGMLTPPAGSITPSPSEPNSGSSPSSSQTSSSSSSSSSSVGSAEGSGER